MTTKEYETIQNILSYIDLTLDETQLKRENLIRHFDNCPLCSASVIECPFDSRHSTPIGYKCIVCGKVLPLESLLEQLAKSKLES